MKNYKPPEDGSGVNDAYLVVMDKEHDGRRRLYGKGVTNKVLNKASASKASYVVPEEVMSSLRSEVESKKTQIIDMRKELEADYERKKVELEEEHAKKMAELQNSAKDQFERSKDALVQVVVQRLISRLPSDMVKEFLS